MDEESNDNIESVNDETEEVLNTEEVEETTPEVETEDIEALKQELAKKEELNKKLFERAKKAEAEAKARKGEVAPAPTTPEKQDAVQLTPMDAILLSKANVTEQEDIEEVISYANFKKIPVSEALKNSTVKTILAEKAEQRSTAQATNTGAARRGSSKLSPEQILANASKGNLPESAEDLAEAHMAAKLKK